LKLKEEKEMVDPIFVINFFNVASFQ